MNTSNNMPNEWQLASLYELAVINMGQSPPSSTYNEDGVGLPFFQGKAEFGDMFPKAKKYSSEPKKIAQEGDVLISVRAPVGPTNLSPSECCIGRGLGAVHGLGGIPNRFLLYYLRTQQGALEKQGTGTTFKAISGTVLSNLPVPLPPLGEQERIVAKIEELFPRLDKGVEALTAAKKQLARYRAAVLKAAFSGKLTEDWRKKHGDGGRSASDLRKSLVKNRESYRWNRRISVTSDLPRLPSSWETIATDELFYFVTSGSRGWSKYYSESGAMFLRVGNLDHMSIGLDLAEVQHVQPPKGAEGTRTRVEGGDILISITADVGMIALAPNDIGEAYINQHVALARSMKGIHPKFLAWFLASENGGNRQFHNMQRGATKAGLGLDDIRSVSVPLPQYDEQNQIVDEIDRCFSLADAIEKAIDDGLKEAGRLRQGILKKAFEGRLVPQDPNDEPASELLKRIQAQREAEKPVKKTRKKRQRKKV